MTFVNRVLPPTLTIDELNKAASLVAETTVPRTEFDAVAAAKTTAESEVQKLKDTMDSACEAERMALQNKTVDIEMREHKVQSAVAEAKQRFDASGLATVITKLQEMVRFGMRTAPDFFKTGIFNPIFWETWSEWEEHAALWCRLAKDPAFKEEAAVDLLHRGSFCSYCGWSTKRPRIEYSDEAAAYARAYLTSKEWTPSDIGEAVRKLRADHDALDASRSRVNVYDMPAYRPEHQDKFRQTRERSPSLDGIQRPPKFDPGPYPYCPGGGGATDDL